MQAKSVNAGQGASWFSCGWSLFKQDYGTWFLMFLLLIGISIVLSLIPFIGSLALAVISPALLGGFMYASSEMEKGKKIEISFLFQGFRDKERMGKLFSLGAIYLIVQVLMMIAMFSVIGGSSYMTANESGEINPEAMMGAGMGIYMLLIFFIGFAILIGFIYSAPLVMLDNMSAVESIKASYSASFKNILPLTVFGLIYFLLAIVAMIPIGLGLLILIPVSMNALYCSYKSIFH